MDIMTAFFIYLLIWWVMIFAVLPLGIETHAEHGKGHDAGAPKFANLKKKLILNSVVSAIVLAVLEILVKLDVIKWHEWFDGGVK